MEIIKWIQTGLMAMLLMEAVNAQQPLISYVRPLVGTSGFGNTYPGAQVPFGGIQISPDTDFDQPSMLLVLPIRH